MIGLSHNHCSATSKTSQSNSLAFDFPPFAVVAVFWPQRAVYEILFALNHKQLWRE